MLVISYSSLYQLSLIWLEVKFFMSSIFQTIFQRSRKDWTSKRRIDMTIERTKVLSINWWMISSFDRNSKRTLRIWKKSENWHFSRTIKSQILLLWTQKTKEEVETFMKNLSFNSEKMKFQTLLKSTKPSNRLKLNDIRNSYFLWIGDWFNKLQK